MICSCGLKSENSDGPTHAYVVSSPSCWATFSSLLQDNTCRLFTDAYMAQHADGDDPRQLQSVTVHLVTIHAIKTHGKPISAASNITAAGVDVGRRIGGFPKLTPPSLWPHTVADVDNGAITPEGYVDSVYRTWLDWGELTIEGRTTEVLDYLYEGS